MKVDIDADAIFEDLWNLQFLSRDYPALFCLYFKVATPERIRKIKEAQKKDEGLLSTF